MQAALAIARKELSIAFTTAWAYVVFTAMVAATSTFFVTSLQIFKEVQEQAKVVGWTRMPQEYSTYKNLTDGVIIPLLGVIMVVTLFIAPLLSMGLFARERKHKTIELLMTAPVRPVDMVVGKYLGGVMLMAATLGLTFVYPLILSLFGTGASGSALEWSTVFLGYFGLLLYGCACMAIGMFISSLTDSEMLASLVSFFVLLVWWLFKMLGQSTEEPLKSVLDYMAVDSQLENMLKGVLELRTLVFFGSVIAFSLLLTHKSVESQRWA